MKCVTDSKWVGLLPGNGSAPGVQPHLVRQGLRHGQQDEADISQRDECGQQNHQVVTIPGRQVGTNGWTGDQTCCKGG